MGTHAFASSQNDGKFCVRKSADYVEGSYLGKLAGIDRTLDVRINLVCLDEETLVSSIAFLSKVGPGGADAVLSFRHASLDEGDLVLSPYSLDPDERNEIPAHYRGTYMKLNLQKLTAKKLEGFYANGNVVKPLKVTGSLDQEFPYFVPGSKVKESSFQGDYAVNKKGAGPSRIYVDIISGGPIVSAETNDNFIIKLFNGPAFNDNGLISVSTPLADLEMNEDPLFYMRARVLDENHFDLYWVSPHRGLDGPMRATKTSNRIHPEVQP
jgi:hypothetical protein